MYNPLRVSRGLVFTTILSLLAVTANAESPIEQAHRGYLPQPPAAVRTANGSDWPVDVDALKDRYTYQPQAVSNESAGNHVEFVGAIAQARQGYVYAPKAEKRESSEQVASQ